MPFLSKIKQLLNDKLSLRLLNILKYGPAIVCMKEYRLIQECIYNPINKTAFKNDTDQYWAAVLRQMAHILDKGCTRYDFEPNHGKLFYTNALKALRNINSHDVLVDSSILWARKKIKYYEVKQQLSSSAIKEDFVPSKISFELLNEFIKSRRSLRNYLPKPISHQTLEQIVEAANWAPSSCNRQTTRVYGTNNPAIVAECMNQCIGATCFSGNVPMFLCFCSDVRSYSMPDEMFSPYIDVALGVQNSNLAAYAQGISITMLTWASHKKTSEIKLREILSIPDYCVIIINAVGGYPMRGEDVPLRKSEKITCNIKN